MNCTLCDNPEALLFHEDTRPFHRCPGCGLIFVPNSYHIDNQVEKERYDQHRNNPEDPGYRLFLSRLAEPLAERLEPGAHGLDFGSGPGPTLHRMLEERGFRMEIYDPFYQPLLPQKKYDFVTATEVVEHFCHPKESWKQLLSLVKPVGILGIMTLLTDSVDFPNWWYKNDPTHVAFYSKRTLEWLGITPAFCDERVIIGSIDG